MKKKVLVVEPLAPVGHKDINELYIELLKNKVDLTYATCEGYPSVRTWDSINTISLPQKYFINGNSLVNRLNYYKILLNLLRLCKNKEFDCVIFLSYDTVAFSLFAYLKSSVLNKKFKKIYIMNHFNIDEILRSTIKRKLFDLIPSEITHICYEQFITDFVTTKLGKKATTIRHNLNNYKLTKSYSNINNKLLGFFQEENTNVVSLSNNEITQDLLDMVVRLDKENYFFNNHIKIFLKTKKIRYISDNVYIFNEFLNDEEYAFIMSRANYILLPYPTINYDLRISGVFFDAITFKKPIICTSTSFFSYIFKKFGEIGFLMQKDEELQIILNKIKNQEIMVFQENIAKITKYYSDDKLQNELMKLIHNQTYRDL